MGAAGEGVNEEEVVLAEETGDATVGGAVGREEGGLDAEGDEVGGEGTRRRGEGGTLVGGEE